MRAVIRNSWPRGRCNLVGALTLRRDVNSDFTESSLTNLTFRFLILVRSSTTAGSNVTKFRSHACTETVANRPWSRAPLYRLELFSRSSGIAPHAVCVMLMMGAAAVAVRFISRSFGIAPPAACYFDTTENHIFRSR
jgi:hypothetical protein